MIEAKSILEMAQGAIMEQVDAEVGKIVDNILDLNTESKKKRTLTLTVDFTPSSDRTQGGADHALCGRRCSHRRDPGCGNGASDTRSAEL